MNRDLPLKGKYTFGNITQNKPKNLLGNEHWRDVDSIKHCENNGSL